MQKAMDETQRRRAIQEAYNTEHGITPTTVRKSKEAILAQTNVADKNPEKREYSITEEVPTAADPVVAYASGEQLEKMIETTKRRMQQAAKDLDFMQAAKFRDELYGLQEQLKVKK